MAIRGSRNRELAKGVVALSRSAMYRKRGTWRLKNKKVAKKAPKDTSEKSEEIPTNARWYPADDIRRPLASRKKFKRATRLRASITPGAVLILVAGKFKGKRVVFLKQLESGLLLVTGPFCINGVPLRRVNQAYVIATSAKVDTSAVSVDDISDDFFARVDNLSEKSDEFFSSEKKKVGASDEKKAAQKKVDDALLGAISKVDHLKSYLRAKFALTKGQYPHEMKF